MIISHKKPSMPTNEITSTTLYYKSNGDVEGMEKEKIIKKRRRGTSRISRLWQRIRRSPLIRNRQRYSVYVLELENNKYYVGSTNNRKRRMKEHSSPRGGSKWTRLHKPVRLVKEYKRIPSDYYLGKEAQVTAELMLQYGINNVRGAMFAKPRNYTKDDIVALTGFLGHYNNLNYKKLGNVLEQELEPGVWRGRDKSRHQDRNRMGQTNENQQQQNPRRKFMVNGRPTDKCYRCGKRGHWASECPELAKNDKGDDKCFRCGRRGHWANECPEVYPWVDSVRVKQWRYGPSK